MITTVPPISWLNPLVGRAQGTPTWVVLAQYPQRTRGTLGADVGLVLEEIQMVPGALTGIVDRLVLRTTVRTGKPRSTRERHLEVDAPSFGIELETSPTPQGVVSRRQQWTTTDVP